MWPGPPSSQSKMTEVFFVEPVFSAECALACNRCGKLTPAMPATPSCRKLRRLMPSQYRGVEPRLRRNIIHALHVRNQLCLILRYWLGSIHLRPRLKISGPPPSLQLLGGRSLDYVFF